MCKKIKLNKNLSPRDLYWNESSMIYAHCNESARSNNVCIPLLMLVHFWNCSSRSENSTAAVNSKSWSLQSKLSSTVMLSVYSATLENSIYSLKYQCYSWNGCEILPGGTSWMSSKDVVSSAAEEEKTWWKGIYVYWSEVYERTQDKLKSAQRILTFQMLSYSTRVNCSHKGLSERMGQETK